MNQYEIDYKQGYDAANDEWLERIDRLRAEIQEARKVVHIPLDVERYDYTRGLDRALSIIDKYREDINKEYTEEEKDI